MNPSIKEIIKSYLVKNKYDGLYNNEIGCSCLAVDLFPCECFHARNCKAGYYNEPLDEDDELWIGSTKEI